MATAQPDFFTTGQNMSGKKEHFDTCRSFLHNGRTKVSKIHPWPLPYHCMHHRDMAYLGKLSK